MPKQDGFLKILLFIVLAVMVFGAFVVLKLTGTEPTVTEPRQTQTTEVDFEPLSEDESTPEIINNQALDELDNLMKELDQSEEDLSDLSM